MIKNLPALLETQVRYLGWENPLEKGMATHSSILPGKFHGLRSLAGYNPWGHNELDMTETKVTKHMSYSDGEALPHQ